MRNPRCRGSEEQCENYASCMAPLRFIALSDGASERSLTQASSLLRSQLADAPWERPAQAFDVQLCVDLRAAPSEPGGEVLCAFLPTLFREGPLQAVAQPRHGRLVQHHFLQMARLHTRVLAPERLEAAFPEGTAELWCDRARGADSY